MWAYEDLRWAYPCPARIKAADAIAGFNHSGEKDVGAGIRRDVGIPLKGVMLEVVVGTRDHIILAFSERNRLVDRIVDARVRR